jgi:hypothetical protein
LVKTRQQKQRFTSEEIEGIKKEINISEIIDPKVLSICFIGIENS